MVLLEVRQVSKVYRSGAVSVLAVDGVSLTVRRGEVVLILGPSGSGKTTLLSIMGCLLRPSQGQVVVEGQDVRWLSDRDLSQLRRERIGFVFQSFNLLGFLTARKNVEVALNLTGVRGRRASQRAGEMLEQVGLRHRVDFLPRQLSGGEKQRVSLARALASDPGLLLADEPTGNLDSRAGRAVVDLLVQQAKERGTGVVIVTHDRRIQHVADRVARLVDGRLQEMDRERGGSCGENGTGIQSGQRMGAGEVIDASR